MLQNPTIAIKFSIAWIQRTEKLQDPQEKNHLESRSKKQRKMEKNHITHPKIYNFSWIENDQKNKQITKLPQGIVIEETITRAGQDGDLHWGGQDREGDSNRRGGKGKGRRCESARRETGGNQGSRTNQTLLSSGSFCRCRCIESPSIYK